MNIDRLSTLLRLRQSTLDDVQRALAAAIAEEHQAETGRRVAAQAIEDETLLAMQAPEDLDVERFARWLKRGRARLRAAEQEVADAAALTASRRAELALARAAAEATEMAIQARKDADLRLQAGLEQRDQDEIGQRRRV